MRAGNAMTTVFPGASEAAETQGALPVPRFACKSRAAGDSRRKRPPRTGFAKDCRAAGAFHSRKPAISPWPDCLMNASITLKSPAECTEAELTAFEAAIIATGETASPTLTERIHRAECLAFLHGEAGAQLLGCGALKRPRAEHRAAMFRRAGATVPPEAFELEIGWLAGEPETVNALVAALKARAAGRPVLVLTSTDGTALLKVLAAHGFQPGGPPYPSGRGDYSNQLFLLDA